MPKQVTKAADNRYCQARLQAAAYNEKLSVRVTAVDCLPGVTEASLKKYELNITTPPNDVVLLMADAYNSPELLNYYCTHECPIGCRNAPLLEVAELDRHVLKLLGKFRGTDNITQTLLDVVEDGVITPDEQPKIEHVLQQLAEISQYIQEFQLWAQKNIK